MTLWQKFKDKYLKYNSLTWWAGFVPLVLGILKMMHYETGWFEPAQYIAANIWGDGTDVSAGALINAGLVIIGLRGSLAGKTIVAAEQPVLITPSTGDTKGSVQKLDAS